MELAWLFSVTDLQARSFEDLRDLPWDLEDCVLYFLMTVLTETHLIPYPHLNLFLSSMTVTHRLKKKKKMHTSTFSQNSSHTVSWPALPLSPWRSHLHTSVRKNPSARSNEYTAQGCFIFFALPTNGLLQVHQPLLGRDAIIVRVKIACVCPVY